MTVFSPSNHGPRGRGPTGWHAANADAERRRAEQAAREADPVEQAVRYLRTRGRTIFRASVHGGPHDKWKMAGRLLSGPDVIAQADALRALTEKRRPSAQPPVRPANDDAAPIKFGTPLSPVPVSTPAARTTATPKKDPEMADISEKERCKARGTTPSRVQQDLSALRAVLGTPRCADLLGVGKSTIGNVLSGHSAVGETILTALYGASGCTLLPRLAEVLAAPAPPVDAPTPEVPAEPATEATAPAAADPIAMFEPVAADDGTLAPPPPSPSLVDLIASATARRDGLLAEAARIDGQLAAIRTLIEELAA